MHKDKQGPQAFNLPQRSPPPQPGRFSAPSSRVLRGDGVRDARRREQRGAVLEEDWVGRGMLGGGGERRARLGGEELGDR